MVAFVFLNGCGFLIQCDNSIQMESHSPDGSLIATVFIRDCGATTNYATVVLLRDARDGFNGDSQKNYVLTMEGRQEIGVRWKNGKKLVLEIPWREVFVQKSTWQNIAIEYEIKGKN